MESAQTIGFSDEAELKDRCQLQFLAQLMRQGADRFVLKGGLAMRALYDSVRLTKDIDFDCEDSVSAQSMKNQLPKALMLAARLCGLTQPVVAQTKNGERACRWRLEVTLPGSVRRMSYEVEISRRGLPRAAYITTATLRPPVQYRMSPFVVRVYSDAAMAAAKVNALLSDNRSVPRDVYDLHELSVRGADPSALWVESIAREVLERKRGQVWHKILAIGFDMANAELLTWLSPNVRATINADRWDEMRAQVAESVDRWFGRAVPLAKSAEEHGHDAQSDADLAGS